MPFRTERPCLDQRNDSLRRREAEEGCESLWDTEQLDGDLASRWRAGIASQPFLKTEAIMRPLRTGEGRRRTNWVGRESRLHLHLQALVAQLHAGSSRLSPAPVTPEEWSSTDSQGMEQHAHLTRLPGGTADIWR